MKDTMIDDMSRAPNADVLEEDTERRCLETKSMYTKTTAVRLTVRSTAGEQERVRSHVILLSQNGGGLEGFDRGPCCYKSDGKFIKR